MPQAKLLELLEGIGDGKIGMDCSIVPLRHQGLSLISTTDFFYPLVDDPYAQGRIACANVLSDLYACGVRQCDNMLMLLGVCESMTATERDVTARQIIMGFNDLAQEANVSVTGGQTVINPWPLVGGVATSVCSPDEFIAPENAVAGDTVVLTKPLGTQVAVNAHQWLKQRNKFWDKIKGHVTKEEVENAYYTAMESMARLNKTGAELMHKYGAHAATDVTGFGLLGHAINLAKNQKEKVNIVLHTLPIISKMAEIDKMVGSMFSLERGFSAETSGGLLLCLPRDNAEAFCKEIEEADGCAAWVIGDVVEGDNTAIIHSPTIVNV